MDFVKTGKRIAYAPSMGGVPHISIDEKFFPFIRENIKKYDAISVREEATLARIKEIMGDSDDLDISIAADPTLLPVSYTHLDVYKRQVHAQCHAVEDARRHGRVSCTLHRTDCFRLP